MAEKGYTLGEEAATRVSEVVRRVETGPRDEGLIRRRRPGAHDQPALQWIECTNNVPDGTGRYAAIWVQYDEQDDTWTDREECYLRPGANGETPVAGQRYLARCQGPHPTTNKPVYVPLAARANKFRGYGIYPWPYYRRSFRGRLGGGGGGNGSIWSQDYPDPGLTDYGLNFSTMADTIYPRWTPQKVGYYRFDVSIGLTSDEMLDRVAWRFKYYLIRVHWRYQNSLPGLFDILGEVGGTGRGGMTSLGGFNAPYYLSLKINSVVRVDDLSKDINGLLTCESYDAYTGSVQRWFTSPRNPYLGGQFLFEVNTFWQCRFLGGL